ncbi:barH-like 1 homeobox protein [Cyanistes caeruleus]|uniref:barH-like 1 homeobox protein n=1 Tax=Cyanistes caeruleus TaxID=156563 RepID=UPI000CDA28FC|nr:barH-like 1 homeobox protein [Cyanistes caeruleus]
MEGVRSSAAAAPEPRWSRGQTARNDGRMEALKVEVAFKNQYFFTRPAGLGTWRRDPSRWSGWPRAASAEPGSCPIKTWFQNRRMKFKRQTQDARIETLFSGLFLPYRYSDTATSSYPHGVDVNVSATAALSLHPAVPNPALLPSVPAQSLQPVLPSPALLLPPGPGLSCYSSVLPAVTLTTEFIKD